MIFLSTWSVIKAAGFTSYLLLLISVILGALSYAKPPSGKVFNLMFTTTHQLTGLIGFLFDLLHGLVLSVDSYIHFSFAAIFIPFASPYEPIASGLGTIALYLSFIVLISTNAISYYLLSSIIYNDREKEIIRLANLEAQEHAKELFKLAATLPNEKRGNKSESESFKELEKESNKGDDDNHNEKADQQTAITLHPFYYVLDWQGNQIDGDEPWPKLREEMIEYLKHWRPKPSEIRYNQFRVDDKNIHLIFAGQPIFKDNQYVGSVITGADISQETIVLRQYMIILIALSGVFLLVSIFLSYLMFGKAMIPIIRSFTKQQQFTADASHELRTPLCVIQSSLEVIEAEEKARLSTFSRQVLDDLKDEVRRMSQLLANLLTLARADSSEIQLDIEVFSLNEELERLYRKFQPVAVANQQQLQFDLPEELWISADRERLVQLLLILLDNAIQYSEKPGTITIAAETRGKSLALSVSDTGKGIHSNLPNFLLGYALYPDGSSSQLARIR